METPHYPGKLTPEQQQRILENSLSRRRDPDEGRPPVIVAALFLVIIIALILLAFCSCSSLRQLTGTSALPNPGMVPQQDAFAQRMQAIHVHRRVAQ